MVEAGGREHVWRPLIVVVLSGVLGGMLAVVLSVATLPDHPAVIDVGPFPFLVGGAAVAGGVLGGWFLAILVLGRSHGGVRCPRCGTENPRGFSACRACELRTS